MIASVVLLGLTPALLSAQIPDPEPPASSTLFVFLDCQGMAFMHCDFDHVRREVTWVNWVRDRQDADVHLLVTVQATASGGFNYTVDLIGLRAFSGTQDTLLYVSDPDDTDPEVREELTNRLMLGLVRYVANSTIAGDLQLSYEPAVDAVAQDAQEDDPWNLWVFRVGANGSVNGESLQRGYSIGGNASANRTSEAFKFNWRASGRYSRDEFDIVDASVGSDTTIVNTRRNYNTNILTVWSLTDHWSAGGTASAGHSSFSNRDLTLTTGPAIEYNIFPYDESTRKSITFLYTIEVNYNNYELVTVTGVTEETLGRHRLEVSANVQQPWGQIFGSVSGTQYFHDLSTHRIDTFLGASFRVFRGFEFNVNGSFSRIKDQFFLPAAGQTPEDILLRRRQRETDFRYRLSVGFSYRFGSKFANVVNPRMGGGGGFFFF
jgi:hypothetical protein